MTDKNKGARGASAFILEKGMKGFTFGKKEDNGAIFAGGKGWQFSFRGARCLGGYLYHDGGARCRHGAEHCHRRGHAG